MQKVPKNNPNSEDSMSGGVEPKLEIAINDKMSKNPSVDLPNQEMNQY